MTKTALITGASGGIGLELAKIHAENGDNLVIVARRSEELNRLKSELESKYNVKVKVIAKDLSVRESPMEIFREVAENNIQVDYLINNAGFGGYGKFYQHDWNIDEAMITVNITALSALTRLFLPGMVERKSGKILNVASTAGMLPGPYQPVYYATKAYVISFSLAIAEELSGTGVTVTTLCPGPVATGFAKVAGIEATNLFKSIRQADEIARIGYNAMMKGKLMEVTQFKFTLGWLVPLLPRKIVLKMSRKMMEKRGKEK
jgi:short-subunit dehydrogenase